MLFFAANYFLSPGVTEGLFGLWFVEHENFHVWQLFTHLFVHKVFLGLFFSMFALYLFGANIEYSLGRNRFLFLYFSAGIGAALLQMLVFYYDFYPAYSKYMALGMSKEEIIDFINNALSTGSFKVYEGVPSMETNDMVRTYQSLILGASGGISGLFVAFATLYPNMPLYFFFIPVPIKAKYLVGGYFLLDALAAIRGRGLLGGSSMESWAGIGSAVVAYLCVWYWKKNSFNNKRIN